MSIIVEAVESVVDAVDKYVVQPIKEDPLSFIATVAAGVYLGPIAAAKFGVSGAAGIGIASGAANAAAGLAQGEDFDEAIKGGAMAGVGAWAGASLAGTGSTPSSSTSALQKGITSTADDFASAGTQSVDDIFTQAAKQSADEAVSGTTSSGYTGGTTAPTFNASNISGSVGDDVLTSSLDDPFASGLTPGQKNYLDASVAGQGAPVKPLDAGNFSGKNVSQFADDSVANRDVSQGVYNSKLASNSANVIDDSVSMLDEAAARDPNFYLKAQDAAESAAANKVLDTAGTNASILNSPVGRMGTGYMPQSPPTPQTMWDKTLGYADDAWQWAKNNPGYSVPIGLTAAGAVYGALQDKPDEPTMDNNAQIGDSRFYDPMRLYNYNRGRIDYTGDITQYGKTSGEHQFFTPTVYEPVQYAAGGSVDPDNYGYYTYGNIPKTMRRFAQGGLSALAKGGNFDGRSDDIPAVLSDGEFVIDAETVALLGNGSSKAGANRLEEMRQAVRKQKGGALSRGKFSPDAKSPLAYLKSSKKSRG